MFGLFKKDPVKTLETEYQKLLVKARDTQRSGDIKGYAKLMSEAEEILKKIEQLKDENK